MSESIRKIVAKNIRLLRKRRKISQLEFAKRCGLTPRYASRMENDPQNLSLDTLSEIARVLEVPISELFSLPIAAPIPKNASEAFANLIALAEVYRDTFDKES